MRDPVDYIEMTSKYRSLFDVFVIKLQSELDSQLHIKDIPTNNNNIVVRPSAGYTKKPSNIDAGSPCFKRYRQNDNEWMYVFLWMPAMHTNAVPVGDIYIHNEFGQKLHVFDSNNKILSNETGHMNFEYFIDYEEATANKKILESLGSSPDMSAAVKPVTKSFSAYSIENDSYSSESSGSSCGGGCGGS